MPTENVSPVTKNRGHLSIPDTIQETAHVLSSSIASEANPAELGLGVPAEYAENFLAAFLDKHCGFANLTLTVTGTQVVQGDIVSVTLTGPTAVGSAAAVAGGPAQQNVINTLVAGNTVTPAVVVASYTATSGDAGQATLALRLQAVATGLVAAINASLAVTGGAAFLATVAAPVAGAFTLVSLLPGGGGALPGFCAGVTINAATSANPGTAGHATLSPLGLTNPFVPQNTNLHIPVNDGTFVYSPLPGVSCFIEITGSEPIVLDPAIYAAMAAAGVQFEF